MAERFPKNTKERGVAEDAKEALLKAGTSAASTILTSITTRRVVYGTAAGCASLGYGVRPSR